METLQGFLPVSWQPEHNNDQLLIMQLIIAKLEQNIE